MEPPAPAEEGEEGPPPPDSPQEIIAEDAPYKDILPDRPAAPAKRRTSAPPKATKKKATAKPAAASSDQVCEEETFAFKAEYPGPTVDGFHFGCKHHLSIQLPDRIITYGYAHCLYPCENFYMTCIGCTKL